MSAPADWNISFDTEDPNAIPYFNWDVPVTNAEVRRALREGDEYVKTTWIARIMREAEYQDIWKYLSLRKDILPRWDKLKKHKLGRMERFWVFLIERWRRDGLI
jgi:hypothetical protein